MPSECICLVRALKQYQLSTFEYLQEYLDEFSYRFNRRFWEPELPLRLLNACLSHVPLKLAEYC